MQDTIKPVIQDTITPVNNVPQIDLQQSDTAAIQVIPAAAPVFKRTVIRQEIAKYSDTTSVCSKNPVADITFYDSLNFIRERKILNAEKFPYTFLENNIQRESDANAYLIRSLKQGNAMPEKSFHNDWLLAVLLFAAFLYSVIHTTSKTMLPEVTRFFFFRGINDPASREIGGLFNWQATLLNLISFFNIALFCYFAAEWYKIIPAGTPGLLVWLYAVVLVILAVTARHFTCVITGSISNQNEVFREYLLGIYQSYRLGGIMLFIIIILISYTSIFTAKFLIISGFIIMLLMYMIRVMRLLLIFINRSISIFYLILYLCSLEILPFLILLKYSFGRF